MEHAVGCQVWLMDGDRPVLGEDRANLLAMVRDKGSITEAARALGISFRHAWKVIHRIEEDVGGKVVASRRGGPRRGSSQLTPQGEELLLEYENKKRRVEDQLAHLFKNPTLTADGIVLIDGRIVLVRRGNEPFKGMLALPGGFAEYGESLEDCVVREIQEETGLRTEVLDLVGIYSQPGRDPRGHIVTAVYLLHAIGGELKAGDDAAEISLHAPDQLPALVFDHRRIVEDYLKASRNRALRPI